MAAYVFFFQDKNLRYDRDHHTRKMSQFVSLHDLFLRKTYISSPKVNAEIAKIVLPRRKKLPTHPKVRKFLKPEFAEEAEQNDDDDEYDEERDGPLMSLDDLLEAEINLISYDE